MQPTQKKCFGFATDLNRNISTQISSDTTFSELWISELHTLSSKVAYLILRKSHFGRLHLRLYSFGHYFRSTLFIKFENHKQDLSLEKKIRTYILWFFTKFLFNHLKFLFSFFICDSGTLKFDRFLSLIFWYFFQTPPDALPFDFLN